jgi:hypothetical protein
MSGGIGVVQPNCAIDGACGDQVHLHVFGNCCLALRYRR